MLAPITITAIASISSLGIDSKDIWNQYLSQKSLITFQNKIKNPFFQACITKENRQKIEELRYSNIKYRTLDDTVLLAIFASRLAVQQAQWKSGDQFGINLGSSRGATQLFEKYYQDFLQTNKAPTLTSPTTTLGNISSWVAQDLKTQGPEISHSVTCSTGLHAILNGVAWLRAGMVNRFLVGASEAPLTPFTISQMQSLKIVAQDNVEFPCRAFDLDKSKNSMVLSEAAAVACLEIGKKENALAYIQGIGYAIDETEHGIAVSEDGKCFQKAMRMAMENINIEDIDAIVMHAPGTVKGDAAEWKAIQAVFGKNIPMLTTNKWQVGHSLGTAGMLSIEMAILMMLHQHFIPIPYLPPQAQRKQIKKVLINSLGFGGNAVCILLTHSL